jgi:hypothetical protein
MPVLDKWQKREAEQHAKDNDVSYEAAVKVLFPDDEPEQAAEGEQAPAVKSAAKVDTSKAKA